MSTGHQHAVPSIGPQELEHILTDPRVSSALAKRPNINRSFDLPFLAGYSRDGKTVYIDRHLPVNIAIGGKSVNVTPFLVTHEHTEKTVMDVLGLKYAPAHAIATEVEHEQVRRICSPTQYEAALKPYIKKDEIEKIRLIPPDLDLEPYLDTKDMQILIRIRAVMNRASWHRAIAGKGLNL